MTETAEGAATAAPKEEKRTVVRTQQVKKVEEGWSLVTLDRVLQTRDHCVRIP